MKRTNIHLSENQLAALKKLPIKRGVPVAVMVRRAIDRYLKTAK